MEPTAPTTVLISHLFQPEHIAKLESVFPGVRFVQLGQDGSMPDEGRTAVAMYWAAMNKQLLPKILAAAPGIRWIQTSTAGFDWLLTPDLDLTKITVTRTAGVMNIPIGEFTIGLMFLVSKAFPAILAAQKERRWSTPRPDELLDKVVGIVGAGAIGHEIAWRAAALGMKVVGTKRSPEPLPHFEQVWPPEELPRLLEVSDFVVLACPLTPETRHMIGEPELRRMKPTAYLLNIARGALVVEDALIRALEEGWIAGACMDAFEQEPLPAESRLWDVPNLIITPHTSFRSPRNLDRNLEEFAANLRRFLAGEPLHNRLKHPELGY